MSAGCVVRSVWLAMGVLAWSQQNTVTGFQSDSSSLGEGYSSRLLELVRIASRLNHQNLARHKRLVATDNAVISGLDPAHNIQTRNVGDTPKSVQSRSERKRRHTAWDDMYNNYKSFHSELSGFITELSGKFKPGAPPQLQYMAIIPDIMPIDDPDFVYQNEDPVVDRVFIILGFTERLLQGARQYVQDIGNNLEWYDQQAQLIRVWSSLVQLTLGNVRLADDTHTIDYYKAGIGDINVGFDSYRQVNVDHLSALLGII